MPIQIGSHHPKAKIDESDVLLIRALYQQRYDMMLEADKLKMIRIAEKFGITQGACSDVIRRKSWKHVLDNCTYESK